jgi:hypothetical protein
MDGRLTLPPGTLLDASYRIERVVGAGGFGITYMAQDDRLQATVAIKEYFPDDFADRSDDYRVSPKSQRHQQTFDWGLNSFEQEARILARFDHPAIVRVFRVFEANGTAYMVMRYEQGKSLEKWLTDISRPPTQDELDQITSQLLDALEILHRSNFLHRDIAPDNIIIRWDGSPVLLDFGAARRAVAQKTRTMTGLIKPGYSPQEQYASEASLQGPWSDLYALGGTLYRAVVGAVPDEAPLRSTEDRVPPATEVARGEYRPDFLAAIDACLRVNRKDRPQSVQEARTRLLSAPTARARVSPAPNTTPRVEAKPYRMLLAIAAVLLVVGFAGLGGFVVTRLGGDRSRQAQEAELQKRAAAFEREQAEARRKAEEQNRQVTAELQRQQAELRQKSEALEREKEESRRKAEELERQRTAELQRQQAERRQRSEVLEQEKSVEEMNSIGDEYLVSRTVGDYVKAREWYEKAAAKGDARAMWRVGRLYQYGLGVEHDYVKAREWYDRAAAKGYGQAMFSLGELYRAGHGVPKDPAKANEWYEKSTRTPLTASR